MSDLKNTAPDATELLEQHFSLELLAPPVHEGEQGDIEEELEGSEEGFDQRNVPAGRMIYGHVIKSLGQNRVYSRHDDDYYNSWLRGHATDWQESKKDRRQLGRTDLNIVSDTSP